MRTTIEINPEHRARLLEIAAMRGEKGFSSVIAEAIEAYLGERERRASATRTALRAGGSLNEAEAAELRRRVGEIRQQWR